MPLALSGVVPRDSGLRREAICIGRRARAEFGGGAGQGIVGMVTGRDASGGGTGPRERRETPETRETRETRGGLRAAGPCLKCQCLGILGRHCDKS